MRFSIIIMCIVCISCAVKFHAPEEHQKFTNNYNDAFFASLFIAVKDSVEKGFEKPPRVFIDHNSGNADVGVFVRFKKGTQNKGCIGYLKNVKDFDSAVRAAALDAVFFDKRFGGIQKVELDEVEVDITIVGAFERCKKVYDFDIGVHSIMLMYKGHRTFMQAQLALEYGYTKDQFLRALCKKEGLPPETYKEPDFVLYRALSVYQVKRFSDI